MIGNKEISNNLEFDQGTESIKPPTACSQSTTTYLNMKEFRKDFPSTQIRDPAKHANTRFALRDFASSV